MPVPQVRKMEPPQGDPLRRYSATDAPVPDGPNGQASPLFCYLNAGKSSLSVAPDSDRYRAELAAADVVVVTGDVRRPPPWASIPSSC